MSRWRALASLGPWWLVGLVVAGGLGWLILGHLREGGYVVVAGIALAAVLRLVLPVPRGGGLEVRSRSLDVLMLGGLAVAAFAAFALVGTSLPTR